MGQRVNASGQASEIVGIQYLRGIAALAVVVHHVLEEIRVSATGRLVPEWIVVGGASGVDIFFVISGFIMLYVSFPPDRPAARPLKFLARRATRIYPFYWVCCLLVIALGAIGFFSSKDFSPGTVAYAFALLPFSSLLVVSWTLSYELFFYLVFAIGLLSRSPMWSAAAATVMLIGLFGISLMVIPPGTALRFLADPIVFEFVLGLFVGLAYLRFRERMVMPLWVGMIGLAVMMISPALVDLNHTGGLDGWSRFLCWGLPSVLVIMAALRYEKPSGAAGRMGEFVGDASYAIYLTHPFALVAYAWSLERFLSSVPIALSAVMVVLCALAGGMLAHVLVEKPMLKGTRLLLGLRLPEIFNYRRSPVG